MARLTYSSRRQLEEHTFHPAVVLLVPFAALFLQVYLPRLWPRLAVLDLPLIVVVFFGVARRSPIYGTITGAVIGLLQDAFTGQAIGVNGISNAVVGYAAASVGVRVDVENPLTRTVLAFGFTMVQGFLYYLIVRHLLGMDARWLWGYQLIRAVANTLVAVVAFALLDRTVLRQT
ncbi:MAG: rod shape-determining protein MreD [Acidobacteriaceae bacterium]